MIVERQEEKVQILGITGVDSGSLAVLGKRNNTLISRLTNIHELVLVLYDKPI